MTWLKKMPTMVVGIDVTHPGPGSVQHTPSIAAVVASCDADFGQYPASMEIQKSKKEVRKSFRRLTAQSLRSSYQPDGHAPRQDDMGAFDLVQGKEQECLTEAYTCVS